MLKLGKGRSPDLKADHLSPHYLCFHRGWKGGLLCKGCESFLCGQPSAGPGRGTPHLVIQGPGRGGRETEEAKQKGSERGFADEANFTIYNFAYFLSLITRQTVTAKVFSLRGNDAAS